MSMKKYQVIMAAVICSFLMVISSFAEDNKDETEFVKKLIERDFPGMAEELCDIISQDPSVSEKAKSIIPLLRAEILGRKADTETEFAKKIEHMQRALEQMEKYDDKNPSIDAKVKITSLLSRMARATADAKTAEQKPEKLAVLSQESERLFNEATGRLEALIEELKKSEEPDKVWSDLVYCSYEYARTLYEHAINSPADKKEAILDKAIKLIIEEIEFLYVKDIYCYEAAVIGGLCYKEKANLQQNMAEKQKNFDEAEKQFDMAIDLKNMFAQQNIPLDDYTIELISRAYFFKAQMLTQRRQNPKAIATVDEMLKLHPKVSRTPLGYEAQMEKSTALEQAKNYVQARNVLNKIIELDGGTGTYAERARQKLLRLGSKDAGDNFEQKLTNIDWMMSRNRFYDAINELRNMVLVLLPRRTPDHDKYLPIAYNKLGQCYFTMGRYYEASFFFEYVFKYFPKDKLAPKAAFQAVRCLSNEYALSENPSDQKKYSEYLEVIVKQYPDDPVAANSKYIYAEQLHRKGEFKKAAELYQVVPENAEAYESALLQWAECLYRLGRDAWAKKNKEEAKINFTDAEAILKKVIKLFNDPDKKTDDPEENAYRDKLRFAAFDQISTIYLHEGVNKPQELMQVVLEAEKLAKDQNEINKISLLKIRTYLNTDKLEEAESLLRQVLDKSPDLPEIEEFYRLVGASFDTNASKMEKNKTDLKKTNSYYITAGQYYLKWLMLLPQCTLEEIQSVSDRLYAIGIKTNELPDSIDIFATMPDKTIANQGLFEQAVFYYTKIILGEYGKINEKDKFKLLLKLARCYGFLRKWQDAKNGFEGVLTSEKLLDENNRINTKATGANPALLTIYQELGFVYRELAKSDATLRHNYDSALTVFANILNATAKESKAWWINKYYVFQILFERGNENDLKTVDIGISNLQRNYPEFDGGKHGMKDKFLSLQKEVKDKLPK